MPIDGHPPSLDRGFGLHICASCRVEQHSDCRPIRLRRLLLMCECPGWARRDGELVILPCLKPAEPQ